MQIPLRQLSTVATSLDADMQALHSQLDDLESSAVKQAISNIETTAVRIETSAAALANTTRVAHRYSIQYKAATRFS